MVQIEEEGADVVLTLLFFSSTSPDNQQIDIPSCADRQEEAEYLSLARNFAEIAHKRKPRESCNGFVCSLSLQIYRLLWIELS